MIDLNHRTQVSSPLRLVPPVFVDFFSRFTSVPFSTPGTVFDLPRLVLSPGITSGSTDVLGSWTPSPLHKPYSRTVD